MKGIFEAPVADIVLSTATNPAISTPDHPFPFGLDDGSFGNNSEDINS